MWWYNSIHITEPLRGKNTMLFLNEVMMKHAFLVQTIPYTADIFVFTYPMYLVVLYLWGINKSNLYYKQAALYIFFSGALATIINLIIQYFWDKVRPELTILSQSQLLLPHLPTDPFPSDHAAVSAAIAMATTLRWLRHQDKLFLRLAWFFWFACGAMSISRVAVAIHWPTDILAGILVWATAARILLSKPLWHVCTTWIIPPLVKIDKWLFAKVFHVQQRE